MYLFGDASAGGYSIRLDGTPVQGVTGSNEPGLLVQKSDLNYGSHSLILLVTEGTISITMAIITVGMGEVGCVPPL